MGKSTMRRVDSMASRPPRQPAVRPRGRTTYWFRSCPKLRRWSVPSPPLPERSECRLDFGGEELRLLPRRKVAAPIDLVEIGEAGIRVVGPAAWGPPDLAGESREAGRDRDLRRSLAGRSRSSCGVSVFPVRTRRRGTGAGQPVQRDVVENVVPRDVARRLPIDERAGDLLVAVSVVVDHPGRQGDG